MNSFGIIGLGVMGRNLAFNLMDSQIRLSLYNRAEDKSIIEEFKKESTQFLGQYDLFTELQSFVQSLVAPRKILLMVKAGEAVDELIHLLLPLLIEGDVLIDGGNSFYRDTIRRESFLNDKGIFFVGCGISGGEKGARYGASIMPGGQEEAVKMLLPYLNSMAALDNNQKPCTTWISENGSGHFIKMVHNGIEYGEMQLLAEIYHLLKVYGFSNDEISNVFFSWNSGKLNSYLLDISAQIMKYKVDGSYLIDLIYDSAGNKGTGSWSAIEALKLGLPNTMMSDAVFARYISSFKNERVVNASLLNYLEDSIIKSDLNLETLKSAYAFARMINHHQGFELMRHAAIEFGWKLDFKEICRIWSNGCIIRSQLMDDLRGVFSDSESILTDRDSMASLKTQLDDLKKTIVFFMNSSIPCSLFSSSYNYFVAFTTSKLPANLIQAQRDYFGAHTYKRLDKDLDQSFHTNWDN